MSIATITLAAQGAAITRQRNWNFVVQVLLLTSLAMLAFAANSVLARLALANGDMDPASYTLVRLVAGALVLGLLVWRPGGKKLAGNWWSAVALFVYAAGFSFAYLALDTGTGAVILFACVQATMIGWALIKGDRPSLLEWLGLIMAFGALVWLVSPGISAPEPLGAMLMAGAGIAWGVYSLRGQSSSDPLGTTGGNFVRAVPFALALLVIFSATLHMTMFGLAMAVLSGAVTSGLGYALWYRVLRQLKSSQAAIVQLTVPALAAIGGVGFSGEELTLRFVVSCTLILGGVALAIVVRQRRQ